jgi:hypothetical protein
LAYVIFFRECLRGLNEYGWGKKIESEGIKLESMKNINQKLINSNNDRQKRGKN